MHATLTLPADEPKTEAKEAGVVVTLADGRRVSLATMNGKTLQELQWAQEQYFARAIKASPKGSAERSQLVRQAYETVCRILAAQLEDAGQPLVMGFDSRYVRLVLRLLRQQAERGLRPRLFEVGYGCGRLLSDVREHGYEVGGIEVSSMMRDQAVKRLGDRYAASLMLGDLRDVRPEIFDGPPTLVYWNDVLEHIPPDEVCEYIAHIRQLLAPGGALVTITPNWLLRPSDVTGDFCPWRTEARGLHLKEYRLSEVTRLLRQAGFHRVTMPLFATHKRLVACGGGGRVVKQCVEPWLDRLPVRAARMICRGLAMSVTIAWK
jgi:2-polyprenyl-3-methyl-5-hydroxy-6-metoxy-1,4-benzoquinol methylase